MKKFTGLFIILIFQVNVSAQNLKPSVEFVELFKNYQKELPRERIYLHTDRDWYVEGDRIWFSAYNVAGSRHFPSQLSSVLYVELIYPDGELGKRTQILLEDGHGKGSLLLDGLNISTGTYQLKAYTKWAKNFGESYVFNKSITVFDDIEDRITHSSQSDIDLQFFPEGGHLIDNITSNIGFKAVGSDGLSRDVSGVIINNMNNDRIEFESVHNGMGVIQFTPLPGATYTAVSDGIEYNLPEPLPNGIAMAVKSDEQFYSVHINSTLQNSDSPLVLFAHVRGEVFYASMVIMDEGTGIAVVPKKNLSTGIVHFTVLDTSGNPASERLVFNRNPMDELNIDVTLNSENLALRSEAVLSLSISDNENSALDAKASISVFDDGIVDFNKYYSNIFTHFNLESEIKGHVENPGFYFSDNDNAEQYLDILLMTQGWRAYDMTKLNNLDKAAEFSLPENGFTISGVIKSNIFSKPLEDATVVVSVGREHSEMDIVTTDKNGRFEISDISINNRQIITVRANDEHGSDRVNIDMIPQFSDLINQYPAVPQFSKSTSADYDSRNTTVSFEDRIENVHREVEQFVDFQMEGELDEITVTANKDMYNWMDDFIRHDGFSRSINLSEREYLQALPFENVLTQIPRVRINSLKGTISVSRGVSSINAPAESLILIDGLYADYAQLRSLPTSEVHTIRVMSGGPELALFGAKGLNGIISVQTRRGFTPERRGLRQFYLEGYQQPSQFYSPRYGITVSRDFEGVDSRVTLFWEPGLEVSSERNNSIRFFTNDIPSEYRIVVEGITETGLPIHYTQTISVDDKK